MQHFLISEGFSEGTLRIHNADLLHQLIKVLRFRKGEKCMLLDGRGKKAPAEILELHKKEAVFEVGPVEGCQIPKKDLHLFCALSKKPATFELILQKATELGVRSITPLITERCQVREVRKEQRLELILKEAFEQSEGCFLPELRAATPLKEVLGDFPEGAFLVGEPREENPPLSQALTDGRINLVIGPEGGFSEEELGLMKAAGAQFFRLGEQILRMETAAIAGMALVVFK